MTGKVSVREIETPKHAEDGILVKITAASLCHYNFVTRIESHL